MSLTPRQRRFYTLKINIHLPKMRELGGTVRPYYLETPDYANVPCMEVPTPSFVEAMQAGAFTLGGATFSFKKFRLEKIYELPPGTIIHLVSGYEETGYLFEVTSHPERNLWRGNAMAVTCKRIGAVDFE